MSLLLWQFLTWFIVIGLGKRQYDERKGYLCYQQHFWGWRRKRRLFCLGLAAKCHERQMLPRRSPKYVLFCALKSADVRSSCFEDIISLLHVNLDCILHDFRHSLNPTLGICCAKKETEIRMAQNDICLLFKKQVPFFQEAAASSLTCESLSSWKGNGNCCGQKIAEQKQDCGCQESPHIHVHICNKHWGRGRKRTIGNGPKRPPFLQGQGFPGKRTLNFFLNNDMKMKKLINHECASFREQGRESNSAAATTIRHGGDSPSHIPLFGSWYFPDRRNRLSPPS